MPQALGQHNFGKNGGRHLDYIKRWAEIESVDVSLGQAEIWATKGFSQSGYRIAPIVLATSRLWRSTLRVRVTRTVWKILCALADELLLRGKLKALGNL